MLRANFGNIFVHWLFAYIRDMRWVVIVPLGDPCLLFLYIGDVCVLSIAILAPYSRRPVGSSWLSKAHWQTGCRYSGIGLVLIHQEYVILYEATRARQYRYLLLCVHLGDVSFVFACADVMGSARRLNQTAIFSIITTIIVTNAFSSV